MADESPQAGLPTPHTLAEVSQRFARDPSRRGFVERIERRLRHRIVDRQHWDPGRAQLTADSRVGTGIRVVLDVEVHLATDRVLAIGERPLRVASIVVEDEIDRPLASGQRETLVHVASGEPGALEGDARLLGEVGANATTQLRSWAAGVNAQRKRVR